MLQSLLLHLAGPEQAEAVIRLGIDLARRSSARVRGLTLLDTRRSESLYDCESAVFAVLEQGRQSLAERQQEVVRVDLSQACLEANLNFDVRRVAGDPLAVLPQEARFHDLVITSVASGSHPNLSMAELMELLARGVQPMLIVQRDQAPVGRVLLAYDGSAAAGRAIRSFLSLQIFREAEHRLLAISDSEPQARDWLREMTDYCAAQRPDLETGYARGKVRQVLVPYAERWQADLIVLGIDRRHPVLRRLLGETAIDLLKKVRCGLYAAN